MTPPVLRGITAEGSSGPALVLGPSLGTSTILWERAITLLREHFTILSVDLPGHGESPPRNEPFTVADLADAVAATATAAGFDTFHYAGVSLGGQVALELALRHPQRVSGVAIICSAAKIGTEEGWRDRAATVRAEGTGVMVAGSAERWFAPGFIEAQPEVSGALLRSLAFTDAESYARCCEALAASDIRSRVPQIDVPVVALWGEHDVVISPADARAVADAARRGVGLEIPGAGHLGPAENPEAVAAALIDNFAKGA